jgi:hypothetical protein
MNDAILDADTRRAMQMFDRALTQCHSGSTLALPARLGYDSRSQAMAAICRREQRLVLDTLHWPVVPSAIGRPRLRKAVHVGCGAAPDTLDNLLCRESLLGVDVAVAVDIRQAAAIEACKLLELVHRTPVIPIGLAGQFVDYAGADLTVVSLFTADKVKTIARWAQTVRQGMLVLRIHADDQASREQLTSCFWSNRCQIAGSVAHAESDLEFLSIVVKK